MKGKGTKEGYNDDYVDTILQSIFMGWSTFFSLLFFFFFFGGGGGGFGFATTPTWLPTLSPSI